jgi:hypothetical protein
LFQSILYEFEGKSVEPTSVGMAAVVMFQTTLLLVELVNLGCYVSMPNSNASDDAL